MLDVALHIAPCLALAALLGFGVAWLLRGVRVAELRDASAELELERNARERELAALQVDLQTLQARCDALALALRSSPGPAPSPATVPVMSGPDDLKHINGVGPALEKVLHKLGVFEFRQMAQWSEADIDFFDAQLERFRGRIRRENWVRSAMEAHYWKSGEWLGREAPPRLPARTDD